MRNGFFGALFVGLGELFLGQSACPFFSQLSPERFIGIFGHTLHPRPICRPINKELFGPAS